MKRVKRLSGRPQVKIADTWDLSSLFSNDTAWKKAFGKLDKKIAGFAKFKGRLGRSTKTLAECLAFDSEFDRLAERVGTYAFLKTSEDQSNSTYQSLVARYRNLATRASEAASYIRPEILALPNAKLDKFLKSAPLAPYRLMIKRLTRFRKYTLADNEERLLAMQGEMAGAAGTIFRQLLDADMKFGMVKDNDGNEIELTNATFSQLLHARKRSVRKNAFLGYYDQFQAHENTLTAALAGSVHKDVYYARVRGYESALEAALYPDDVPVSVYDSLIEAVRNALPSQHHYYDLRRGKMKLKDIHHYDTYVPILAELDTRRTWKQAVNAVIASLEPLGSEYCGVLEKGLRGRWCDRYPNVGKQSGAFSCGSFDGEPYILMNYQPKVLDHVFTLAHEAGHSMHSYNSAGHQPYEYYDYTIFVAEVASTFNEQLLSRHLLDQAGSDKERAYLINRDIDSIRATIIRQTMFAEFEKQIHEMAESGEPLTVQSFKDTYRKLLEVYFGPEFTLDDQLSLEGLRIPHFYRAFYVYKYATGLSAAIALSRRVLDGSAKELNDYLKFLKGGCSKDPLDLLKGAGVDMRRPEPVETALEHFSSLVNELEALLN